MGDDGIRCDECDVMFAIAWYNSSPAQGGPKYCPFCGSEIDYDTYDAGGE